MPSPIPQIYKSIVRATSDMIEALNSKGTYTPIAYHNWEERGKEQNLPKQTLIGIDGFSFEPQEGLWNVKYVLAVSSYNDVNLLEEIEMLGDIDEWFGQGMKVKLIDLSDGTVNGELLVTDFKLFPMSQSELRNYRTIGLELHRTGR